MQMINDQQIALENQKATFKIEKERFEKMQLEFEDMKANFLQNGGQMPEESKSAVSIAAVRSGASLFSS